LGKQSNLQCALGHGKRHKQNTAPLEKKLALGDDRVCQYGKTAENQFPTVNGTHDLRPHMTTPSSYSGAFYSQDRDKP